MENSIEEAIKIMKHWVEYEKNNKEKINRADELINIQETILSDYKRVLKENEKLKALDSSNSKMIANMSKRHFQDREKIRNGIPVQKIKDKIEEEKLPLVIVGGRRNKRTLEYGIKLGRRQALQELLGSEE